MGLFKVLSMVLRSGNFCKFIVTGFRVLLISQHLFLEILLEAVLGVHVGSVKIKSICIKML
jgi:hypothetical protein